MNAELCRVDFEERQHDRMQAAREEDYAMRSEPIIDELADTIVYGGRIEGCDGRKWYPWDFVNNVTEVETACLICYENDELIELRDTLRKRMTEEVKDWLRDSYEGQSIVEREMEDA